MASRIDLHVALLRLNTAAPDRLQWQVHFKHGRMQRLYVGAQTTCMEKESAFEIGAAPSMCKPRFAQRTYGVLAPMADVLLHGRVRWRTDGRTTLAYKPPMMESTTLAQIRVPGRSGLPKPSWLAEPAKNDSALAPPEHWRAALALVDQHVPFHRRILQPGDRVQTAGTP
ncbi:MAG: hypothetical protein ABJA49_06735, partial [Betaproteobacteria bacterium]